MTITSKLKRWLHALAVMITAPAIPLPPHCCNISGLLMHMCDGDHDLHRWVLRWLALPLRTPGVKMSTCLVFNGCDEHSMAIIEHVMSAIYGLRARSIPSSDLSDTVSSVIAGAHMVFVQADNFMRIRTRHPKALASLVESSHVWTREAYQRGHIVVNQMNFMLFSYSSDFLPEGMASRCLALIEIPPAPDGRFHRAVNDEIANGGIEAFRNYLLNDLDMAEFTTTTRMPEITISLEQITAASAA